MPWLVSLMCPGSTLKCILHHVNVSWPGALSLAVQAPGVPMPGDPEGMTFEIFEGPCPGSFAVSVQQTTSTCAISGVFSTPRRLTFSQASGLLAAKDTLSCGKIFEIFRQVQLGASPKAVIAGLAS